MLAIDVVDLADVDLAAEAAFGRRPQEGHEARRGEGGEAGPISVIVARLRNWRRLTPMASSSGGTHTTGVAGSAGTRAAPPPLRASLPATLARSTAAGLHRRQIDLGVLVAPSRLATQCARTADVAAASRGDEHDARPGRR